MANNTTINSELFTNLLAEAQFAAYENSIARQIVTPFDYPANAGKVLQVPVYSAVTATGLTEGQAPNAEDTNTTSATITLGEIGTYFQVTDFLRDSAERDVIADLGMNAGMAIAEKMDTDVFALFNSFTNSVGTEDGAITVDNIFEAVSQLRENKVVGPLAAVLSPRQALQLKKELATVGGANTELNAVGAVFAPTAMGHAMRGGVSMETERKAAARATDIMMTAVTGQAILQNVHGVKIVGSDSD